MSFYITPGSALAIRVNAHRSAWDGSICKDPTSWSCLADPRFQERYCARGVGDCFHLATFRLRDPSVVIEENGGSWIFEKDIHAFDDHLMLLWTMDFEEPRGVREGPASQIVIGAYRVKSVEKIEDRFGRYRVRPHEEGWTRFAGFRVPTPFMRTTGGPYVRQIDRNHVRRLFGELAAESDDAPEWFSPEDPMRFRNFADKLDDWLDRSREVEIARAEQRSKTVTPIAAASGGHTPLAGLAALISPQKLRPAPPTSSAVGAPPIAVDSQPPTAPPQVAAPPIAATTEPEAFDPAGLGWMRETYGAELVTALRLGAATKPLIVLRGHPGVGKSTLALRLIEDPKRERTLIVPVSSTWRGPEDLLGYVHPVDHQFIATPFLQFMIDAEAAWLAGDRSTRVVVFEEFNLSQPEHWFADLLALTQFTEVRDRTWHAGCPIRGRDDKRDVFLSPALRFVATVNVDHTTRPLSPRVLDRAVMLQLELDPRQALARASLEIEEAQVAAILDLDDALRDRGAGFSMRSALTLAEAMKRRQSLGLDAWAILDFVLGLEVLGKVRLHARDPNDDSARKDLARFQADHGKHLPRCAERIQDWLEQLAAGRDVVQA